MEKSDFCVYAGQCSFNCMRKLIFILIVSPIYWGRVAAQTGDTQGVAMQLTAKTSLYDRVAVLNYIQNQEYEEAVTYLAPILKKEDGRIGAYLTLCRERAFEQSDRMDRMAAEGMSLPPLGGVPVGIKDVMSTRGVRTTAGSKILAHYIPPYDSTAVARLEAAGAVVLGKTNCDEFAMGSSNENSAFHPVRNPRDFAEINPALFAETRVDERLVVVAAKPAGVKAARKSHLQVVARFAANFFMFRRHGGVQCLAIRAGDVGDVFG